MIRASGSSRRSGGAAAEQCRCEGGQCAHLIGGTTLLGAAAVLTRPAVAQSKPLKIGLIPIGFYVACLYVNSQIVEAALRSLDGKSDDPAALIPAIKAVSLSEMPRGPVSFDRYGNVVFDCYIRRVEKQNGRMTNRTLKVYPKVSQFWNFDPEEFLKNPVFSRDYPPTHC
jgi:hypothetical protein